MNLAEYAEYDGLGLAELVRNKDVTPQELAKLAFEAIEKVDPKINAVIETYTDELDRFDVEIYRDGTFVGVPFLIKDIGAEVAGHKQELGSRLFVGHVAQHDSNLTKAFRQSGLINLGRTATPEFGCCLTTESILEGDTHNPWNLEHTAGGSSGGAAAAVSAGVVPLAHANDAGGSIRVPAANCGLVGLKASRGRVSQGPDVAEFIFGIVQELVVSRTVRDTAAALDATSKPAVGDPFVIVQPERPYLQEVGAPAGTLRIGLVSSHWSGKKYDKDVALALDAVAKRCEELGHHVEPVELDVDEQLFFGGVQVYFGAFFSVYIEYLAKQLGRKVDFDLIELQNAQQIQAFEGVDYTDVFLADLHLNAVRRTVAAVFEDIDLLLLPTKGTLPEKLDVLDPSRAMSDGEQMELWSSFIGCTTLFNITGNPAISLPLGQSASGLPIGIQFAAPFGDETTLIRISSGLEEAMPWRQRKPPVHVSA